MLDFRKLLLSRIPPPGFAVLPLFSAKTEGELATALGINFRKGELADEPLPPITPLIENYSKRKALPHLLLHHFIEILSEEKQEAKKSSPSAA